MTSSHDASPLVVDLDGTLVKLDTLFQAFFVLLRRSPSILFKLPRWLAKGPAYLKEEILSRVELDASTLPYHPELMDFLKQEKEKGRRLILATAANFRTADAVAKHTGLFSEVYSSDKTTNLKSARKLEVIQAQYPHFAYAGNDAADIPLWEAADEILLVNPSKAAKRAFSKKADHIFCDKKPLLKRLVKGIRAHQWLKNVLIFSPVILAHQFTNFTAITHSVLAFFSFSFAASTIYVLNDLFDLSADQHHPRKCRRPFAAGDLQITTGLCLIPVLALLSLLLALPLPRSFMGMLLFYYITTTAYSWRLKQLIIVDVLTLAVLYTLRIMAGGMASCLEVSSWLVDFSIFFFLSLALVKRLSEQREIEQASSCEQAGRERDYSPADLPILLSFGAASGYISVFVFTRYLHSDKVVELYERPESLWLFTPLLLYWVTRIWMLAWRGKMNDDPVAFAATDIHTYFLGALGVTVMLFATWPI